MLSPFLARIGPDIDLAPVCNLVQLDVTGLCVAPLCDLRVWIRNAEEAEDRGRFRDGRGNH